MRAIRALFLALAVTALAACGGSRGSPYSPTPFFVTTRLSVGALQVRSVAQGGLHLLTATVTLNEQFGESAATLQSMRFAYPNAGSLGIGCFSTKTVPAGGSVTLTVSTCDEALEVDLKGSLVELRIIYLDPANHTAEVRESATVN